MMFETGDPKAKDVIRSSTELTAVLSFPLASIFDMIRNLKTTLILVIVLSACNNLAYAQQKEKPFQDNLISALFDPAVLRDLELIDDQRNDLETILKELKQYRQTLTNELREYRDSGVNKTELESRRQKVIQQLNDRKSESMKKIENVLLPHQIDRLRQSTVQVMMRETAKREKVPSGLLTPQMMEYLEIDEEQAEEIRDYVKKLQEELAAQVKKLRAEATEKLMKQLSPEQRKKYKELIGDDLENIR